MPPDVRFVVRRTGARCLALAALALVLLSASSCSDKSRRLSPKEVQDYKLGLINSQRTLQEPEISSAEAEELMLTPAFTEGEIDDTFDRLKARYAEKREADKATAEGKLTSGSRSAKESSGAGGSTPPR